MAKAFLIISQTVKDLFVIIENFDSNDSWARRGAVFKSRLMVVGVEDAKVVLTQQWHLD